MDLRVTVTARDRSTVVHVDGRLTSRSLGELEQLVRTVDGPVVMDLSNLLSADDAGVAVLRSLAGQGARLVRVSPYVALLLSDDAPGAAAVPKARRQRRRNR